MTLNTLLGKNEVHFSRRPPGPKGPVSPYKLTVEEEKLLAGLTLRIKSIFLKVGGLKDNYQCLLALFHAHASQAFFGHFMMAADCLFNQIKAKNIYFVDSAVILNNQQPFISES